MKWNNPKTLTEVRDMLCEGAAAVMNDRAMCPQVHEMSNALGKVINECKVKLEYHHLRREIPTDHFIAG